GRAGLDHSMRSTSCRRRQVERTVSLQWYASTLYSPPSRTNHPGIRRRSPAARIMDPRRLDGALPPGGRQEDRYLLDTRSTRSTRNASHPYDSPSCAATSARLAVTPAVVRG